MPAPALVIPPAEPIVDLAEMKAFLRVETSDDDTAIEGLIAAATARYDGYSGILGRALVTQTWRVVFPTWGSPIRLPLLPVQSVTVKYFDSSNLEQTLDADQYEVSLTAAVITPLTYRPTVYRRSDAWQVTFVAGYGDAEAVPAGIKHAIRSRVRAEFDPLPPDQREAFIRHLDAEVVANYGRPRI